MQMCFLYTSPKLCHRDRSPKFRKRGSRVHSRVPDPQDLKQSDYELEISVAWWRGRSPSPLSHIEIESKLSNCFSMNLPIVQNFSQILFTHSSKTQRTGRHFGNNRAHYYTTHYLPHNIKWVVAWPARESSIRDRTLSRFKLKLITHTKCFVHL